MAWTAEVGRAWPPPADVVAAWSAHAEARGVPFLTVEWCDAWLRAEPRHTPFVLVGRRPDGTVGGVLPLVRRAAGPFGVLQAPGGRLVDWIEPLCAPGAEPAFATACGRCLAAERASWAVLRIDRALDPGWRRALLAGFPGRGAVAVVHKAAEPLPFAALARDAAGRPVPVLGGKHRRELGRMRRRVEEAHALRVLRAEDAGQAAALVDRLLELWALRWGPPPAAYARHHRAFAAAAQERGWLRLWALELDGAVAAVLYGWRLGDRAFAYQQAFDPAQEHNGTGLILLREAVEAAAAEGAGTFELLRGEGLHKRRFATDRRHADSSYVVRRGHPLRAGLVAFAAGKARVRSLPDERRARVHAAADRLRAVRERL